MVFTKKTAPLQGHFLSRKGGVEQSTVLFEEYFLLGKIHQLAAYFIL